MTPEARLRLRRILWAVFLACVGLYAFAAYVLAGPSGAERASAEGFLNGHLPPGAQVSARGPAFLLPLLVLLGVAAVLASIVVGRAYARRAAAERRPELLQVGLIVSVALCEAAALFGVVGLLVTGDSYSYVLFVIGAVGILLRFPRREQILAASGKTAGRMGGGFGQA